MKKFILIFLLICSTAFAGQWCDDPDVEGCWTFDIDSATTAYDISGNENNGTAQNQATLLSSGCVWGGCWQFDGDGDSLTLGTKITLDNSTANSVCFWMNGDDISGANTNIAIGDLSDADNFINIFSQSGQHGQIEDSVGDGDIFDRDSGDWADNTWTHVCFVNDATDWAMWVNGSVQTDTETSGSNNLEITDLGHGHSTTTIGFDGELDEIIIVNRELVSSEINDIKNNGIFRRRIIVME